MPRRPRHDPGFGWIIAATVAGLLLWGLVAYAVWLALPGSF